MIQKTGFLAEKLQNKNIQSLTDILFLTTLICQCCIVILLKGSSMFLGIGTALLTFALIMLLEISSDKNFFKFYLYKNCYLCFVGKFS